MVRWIVLSLCFWVSSWACAVEGLVVSHDISCRFHRFLFYRFLSWPEKSLEWERNVFRIVERGVRLSEWSSQTVWSIEKRRHFICIMAATVHVWSHDPSPLATPGTFHSCFWHFFLFSFFEIFRNHKLITKIPQVSHNKSVKFFISQNKRNIYLKMIRLCNRSAWGLARSGSCHPQYLQWTLHHGEERTSRSINYTWKIFAYHVLYTKYLPFRIIL